MYFLIGMLVSFVSVFLTSLFGSMIHKNDVGTRSIVGGICAFIYGLILWWIFWGTKTGIYGPAPFFLSILIGAIIGAIIASSSFENDFQGSGLVPGAILGGGYLIYVLIGVLFFSQSSAMHWREQASLVGDVKTVSSLSEMIKPADNAHICQVSVEIAKTIAHNALSKLILKDGVVPGSRYVTGEPTKQFVDGSYWWIFPLEFDGYFKWKQDAQVPGYLRVSAENPSEQPQAVQTDKNGKEIHIKYLNSACFENNAERYLRSNGYLNSVLEDWTFETDDNWKPFYTVSVINRTLGFEGKVVKGVVVLDLQTGNIQYYDDAKAPEWIDRIIPQDVMDYNTFKWGEYQLEGWWYNAWHNDKSQKPTPGSFLVYEDNKCQWFTGFTSMNDKDKALTGFMLMDARTGKSSFLKANGVTEDVAYDAAKTLWNNYTGYEPTELVPYNIYGLLTYVIPMKCKDQFSGISLVALNNVSIKAKGDSLEEALRNYRDAIVVANSNGLAPEAGKVKDVQLTGIVEFVGPAIASKTPIISFKLKGIGKIFQASYSDANPKILLIKEGQSVKITYTETTEVVVSVTNFDIPSVLLEKGSVTQGKYIDNNKTTDKEVKRIDDQQKVDTIINSDAVKNVDPEELQKFLDDQAAKKAK